MQHSGARVTPVEPQEILRKFAKLNQDRRFRGFEKQREADRALQADWALRIAQGEELKRDVPNPATTFDWTITLHSEADRDQPRIKRLEVRDRQGDVVARKSLVQHFIPARLFYFGFDGDGSGGRFRLGGGKVTNQPRYYELDGAVELLRVASVPQPTPRPDVVQDADRLLATVLDNPAAKDGELLIARIWLDQFKYNAGGDQMETIARILLDDRIADPVESLRTAVSSKADLTPLRAGLVRRYRRSTDSKSKTWYITALVRLADGTFAEPTDDERAIWAEALSVTEAAPFVERLADQGADAVPALMTLLEDALALPWHRRRHVLGGVCEALKRLGPSAVAAAPRITALIEDVPHSLLNSADDRRDWLVALYLMGVDAKDLPYGVNKREPSQITSESRRIEQYVQVYRASRRAPGGWQCRGVHQSTHRNPGKPTRDQASPPYGTIEDRKEYEHAALASAAGCKEQCSPPRPPLSPPRAGERVTLLKNVS
ncbi:MAG: hypothetical protein R3B90_18150 [Planctomycetaceae bacterium]